MKTTAVHFTVDGEGFTDLIRNMWAEGRPNKAFTMVNEGLGMNEDLFLQLVEGKKKLVNDEEDPGALFLVDDKMTRPVSLTQITKHIEKEYKKAFKSLSAKKRTHSLYCGDFDDKGEMIAMGLASATAAAYRKKESKNEKQNIAKLEINLKNIGEELEYVYKLQNKPVSQFLILLTENDHDGLSDIEMKEIEFHNTNHFSEKYSPEKETTDTSPKIKNIDDDLNKENEYSKFLDDYKNYQDKVTNFNKRMEDETLIAMSDDNLSEFYELKSLYNNLINSVNKYCNFNHEITIPHPEFVDARTTATENGYILPNGRFYPVGWMGHHYLEDDLKELGLIPEEGINFFGAVEWAKLGWFKISSREVIDLTPPYHEDMNIQSDIMDANREYYTRPNIQWRTLKSYLDSRNWNEFRTPYKSFDNSKEIYKDLKTQENIWFDKK